MSKGDKRRPSQVSKEEYKSNYERIFDPFVKRSKTGLDELTYGNRQEIGKGDV